MKGFYWFAAVWLVAVAGCAVVALGSGYERTRVAKAVFSVGLTPIVTAYGAMSLAKWMQRPHED